MTFHRLKSSFDFLKQMAERHVDCGTPTFARPECRPTK
jgi:hypothetical protein